MHTSPILRIALLVVEAAVAATAAVGGLALVVGSLAADLPVALTPDPAFLAGSPFTSYLVPGLVLAAVLGGIHALAFALLLRRRPSALLAGAAAGFTMLGWIFVQQTIIPFSFLQAVYFAAGALELGVVLLALGVVPRRRVPEKDAADARSDAGADAGAGAGRTAVPLAP